MALIRPPRKGSSLQPAAPALEVSLEQQILTEIQGLREDQQGTRGQIRDMRTMLFGVGDAGVPETAQGRLSRQDNRIDAVERKVESHDRQIVEMCGRMGSAQASTAAYWTLARVAWAFCGGVLIALAGGGFEALIGWFLVKQH